ncbi:MAG: hypothetical protein RBR15_13370 [Sphaerochaeta sp.]|nr:hypothetical protein [Sphaerochaeta sp.]
MKRLVAVVLLASALLSILGAAPYLGVAQSVTSTSVEVGYLTNSIDQNLSLSMPLLGSLESSQGWYATPVASMNILYKGKVGPTFAIGVGPTLRMGWEFEKALGLQAGLLVQLSLEAPAVMDILFLELAYLPQWFAWMGGTPSSGLLKKSITDFVRFGYRHAF